MPYMKGNDLQVLVVDDSAMVRQVMQDPMFVMLVIRRQRLDDLVMIQQPG